MELHTYPSSDLMGPSFFPWSSDEVHAARPSKGNQQPNDKLRMKADELDKLFAAPKLRPHGDQTASSQMPKGNWVMEGSSNSMEFDANLVLQMMDNQNYFHNMMQKLGNLSQPENCRGRFYDRYMIKRDAKLREEWRSKRIQKEASMKDMQDRLEQTRAKMMARLEGSADRKELALQDRRHAERLRSSGVYSRMPSKEQQTIEFIQSEEEEGIQEFSEEVQYVQDKFYNDALFSDSSSTSTDSKKLVSTRSMSSSATQIITRPIPRPPVKSTNSQSQHTVESLQCEEEEDLQKSYEQVQYSRNKSYNGRMYTDGSYRSMDSNKLLTSRSVSSSATRTSIAPIPRPSGKAISSGHIRRRSQPEILFEQSISNSGDFRKENKKPSNRISKVTTHAESRNLARSKSTSTRKNSFQVDKPQRSHSLRKSTASPGELKNLSPLSHNSATLAPSTFSKEHSEQTVFSKMQRSGESKTFLRKGSGIGPRAGAGLAKQKASMASEILIDGEVYESVVDRYEESPDHIINDKDEEFERAPPSGRDIYISADSDSEDPTSSQGSRESSDHRLENTHVLRSPSQVDIDLDAIPLSFNSPARNVQEPPGESHGSWNSRVCHSFSYIRTDASMDTPTSSSASWNSHPLNQMRNADAIRIRKKWGSAQNPFSVSNASRQSPKDASEGIKRLLTFGKKSRGVESKVTDWVSASTVSEGDDDAEDGNNGVNQSSENPRMSRLGYTLPANDGSNVTKIFSEQVPSLPGSIQTHANFKLKEDHQSGSPRKAPRSFFSLPSFRNRGSESNLR